MITDLPSSGNKWFEVLFFVFFLVYIFCIKMCHHTLQGSNDTTDIAEKEFERSVCITAVAEVLCAMHVQKPGEERSVQQQHPPR